MKNRIIKIVSAALLFTMICFGVVQSAKAWNGLATLNPYTPEMVEMRAVWVATVSNIDFPKQKGTSETAINDWKENYIKVLDDAQSRNLNTIIFQIRPNNDAFYPSEYNPWSEYLAGFGVDPGWDPLEWMLEVTHARGMEYHAWLNPYRASTAGLSFDYKEQVPGTNGHQIVDYDQEALDTYKTNFYEELKNKVKDENGNVKYDNPIFGANVKYDVVLGAENKFVLNPASEDVLDHLNNTISELVENYDIDGIHFDDYFYPNDTIYKGTQTEYQGYTFSTEPYRDMQDYKAYRADGGTLSIYNWRRENINTLIKNLSDIIREANKTKEVKCAFGISPCARWAPNETCTAFERGAAGGMGNNCNDYYAYSDLFADTRKWAVEEWIDYIVPQCYTELDTGYASIVSWWSNVLKNSSTKLYIGQGIYQVDTWGDSLEMYYQVRYNQSYGYGVDGYYFYNYKSLLSGKGKAAISTLSKGIWKRNSLTPTYDAYEYKSTVEGDINITKLIETAEKTVVVYFDEVKDAKAYVLEEYVNDVSEIDFNDNNYVQLAFAGSGEIEFTPAEGKKYVLVPVAQNNVVQTNYVNVNLEETIRNNVPEVSIEEIPSEVATSYTLEVVANIKDTDNTIFTYEWYISVEGDDYKLYSSGSVEGNKVTCTWKTYPIGREDIKFKIIVNDSKDTAEAESNVFDIVENLAPTTWNINYNLDGGTLGANSPTTYVEGQVTQLVNPTKENYTFTGWTLNGEKVTSISASQVGNVTLVANWEPLNETKPGKGCGKSSAQLMVACLSAVSLAVIIMKKK